MSQEQVTTLVTLLFSSSAIGLYAAVAHFLFSKLKPSDQARAKELMGSVVAAVEQTAQNYSGPQKQQEALRQFGILSQEVGLRVSPTLAQTVLEEAVFAVNQLSGYAKTQQLHTVKALPTQG